jgi:hypothetical protein
MISPSIESAAGHKRLFSRLGGLPWRQAYLFHVAFYETPPVDENDISKIHICMKETNGGELPDGHTFDVLLGMDVLTTSNLQVDKDGTFSFSF